MMKIESKESTTVTFKELGDLESTSYTAPTLGYLHVLLSRRHIEVGDIKKMVEGCPFFVPVEAFRVATGSRFPI